MAEAGWRLFRLPDCAARRVDRARAGGRGIPPHAAWFELATAEVKASGLAQDVVKASEESRLQVLCAPVDGTVEQLAIHTIGGVVTPAQALLEIVPLDSRLKSRRWCRTGCRVCPRRQSAEIKVDTFSFTKYSLLYGTVLNVSANSIDRIPLR